jgi:hypothetical protein
LIVPSLTGSIGAYLCGAKGALVSIPFFFISMYTRKRSLYGGLSPGMKAVDGQVHVVGHSKFENNVTNLLSFSKPGRPLVVNFGSFS